MDEEQKVDRGEILAMSMDVVAAYLGNNPMEPEKVPEFITSIVGKMNDLANEEPEVEVKLEPAVPIRKSVTDDFLICLEDGKKLKMLKRHLMTHYNMTPEDYRSKWGLKPDYPMVAPNYAKKRQELAKRIGLGRKPKAEPEPAPAPKRASRSKKAAAAE